MLLSGFEMVKGYTPSISCLPSSPLLPQLKDANLSQQEPLSLATHSLHRFAHGGPDQALSAYLLYRDNKLY